MDIQTNSNLLQYSRKTLKNLKTVEKMIFEWVIQGVTEIHGR